MTVVSGQRTVENVSSSQRAIALDKDILLLEPDVAPLTVLTKRMQRGGNVSGVEDFEFSWMEDESEVRFDAVNNGAGYTDEEEEVKVDTVGVFYKGSLVRVPRTGEIMRVAEVGAEKVKFTRGYSGTTEAALVDDDPLFVIGSVAEEGDVSFTARSFNPTKITNYTQIFRRSVEASESWLSSGNLTNPHDWAHQHRKVNIEHLKDIEHAALFGSKGKTTGTNSRRISTTGGALSFLTANNQDAGGTLTEAELESWVRSITRYGTKQKTVFCSRLVGSVINNFAVGRLQTIQADMDKNYGVALTKYTTMHGELNIVVHDLLEGAVWGGYAIALDMKGAAVGYRYLSGGPHGSRDTKLLMNRQANDADLQRDELLTEAGFKFGQVKTAGVLTGVTG